MVYFLYYCSSRLCEAWHSKMSMIIDVVKLLLEEENFNIRMAISEVLFKKCSSY